MKGKERKQNSKIPTWNEYFKNVTHMKKKKPHKEIKLTKINMRMKTHSRKNYTQGKSTHTHTQLDEDSIFEIKIDMK